MFHAGWSSAQNLASYHLWRSLPWIKSCAAGPDSRNEPYVHIEVHAVLRRFSRWGVAVRSRAPATSSAVELLHVQLCVKASPPRQFQQALLGH